MRGGIPNYCALEAHNFPKELHMKYKCYFFLKKKSTNVIALYNMHSQKWEHHYHCTITRTT